MKDLQTSNYISIDGKPTLKPGLALKPSMRVSLTLPEPHPASPQAEDIRIEILHEDDQIVVVDKPAGLVVPLKPVE